MYLMNLERLELSLSSSLRTKVLSKSSSVKFASSMALTNPLPEASRISTSSRAPDYCSTIDLAKCKLLVLSSQILANLHSFTTFTHLIVHRFFPSTNWWCWAHLVQQKTPITRSPLLIGEWRNETQRGRSAGQSAQILLFGSVRSTCIRRFKAGLGTGPRGGDIVASR